MSPKVDLRILCLGLIIVTAVVSSASAQQEEKFFYEADFPEAEEPQAQQPLQVSESKPDPRFVFPDGPVHVSLGLRALSGDNRPQPPPPAAAEGGHLDMAQAPQVNLQISHRLQEFPFPKHQHLDAPQQPSAHGQGNWTGREYYLSTRVRGASQKSTTTLPMERHTNYDREIINLPPRKCKFSGAFYKEATIITALLFTPRVISHHADRVCLLSAEGPPAAATFGEEVFIGSIVIFAESNRTTIAAQVVAVGWRKQRPPNACDNCHDGN